MLMPQVVETLICKDEFSQLMGEVAGLQVGQVEMKLLKTIIMKMRKKRRFLRILLIVLLATILFLIIKELWDNLPLEDNMEDNYLVNFNRIKIDTIRQEGGKLNLVKVDQQI